MKKVNMHLKVYKIFLTFALISLRRLLDSHRIAFFSFVCIDCFSLRRNEYATVWCVISMYSIIEFLDLGLFSIISVVSITFSFLFLFLSSFLIRLGSLIRRFHSWSPGSASFLLPRFKFVYHFTLYKRYT